MVKNGQRTFNLNMKVSADAVADVEAEIKTHAKWMRDTHSYDDSKIQLVQVSRLTKPPLISLHRATPLLYNMRIRHTHLIQDYSSKEELWPKSNKKCF